MKRMITATALCAAMILTCAVSHAATRADEPQPVPSDASTSRSEWLPEFTDVHVSAAIDIRFVHVPESEAPRIVFDTYGLTDTKFKAFVDKHGVLNITERILRDSRSRTTVEVYYHSLRKLDVSDAYVSFANPLQQRMARLELSDGAKLAAEVDADDLEVGVSGRETRVKLTGRARYLEIEASSGLLDASALESMSAEVTASYGAGVAVRVTERLKASTSASATISYRGTPSIIKGRSAVLGGSIHPAAEEEND